MFGIVIAFIISVIITINYIRQISKEYYDFNLFFDGAIIIYLFLIGFLFDIGFIKYVIVNNK